MNKYIIPLLLIAGTSANAEEFYKEFDLFTDNSFVYNTNNSTMVEEADTRYFTSIDSNLISSVVYNLDLPRTTSSLTFSNSVFKATTRKDFLTIQISRNGIDYINLANANVSIPYSNFIRDSTYGSYDNPHIFIRALFAGPQKIFISDKVNSVYPFFKGNVIPEPTFLALLCGVFLSLVLCRIKK